MIADGSPPTSASAGAEKGQIARRLVLFLYGFEMRGVKVPYRNFAADFEKHKQLTGAKGTVSALEPPPFDKPWLKGWRANLTEPGAEPVETVFDFLEWQDLIPRRHRFRFLRLSLLGITTLFAMLRRGIQFKMLRYSKSHGILAIFPFLALALYLWIMATLVWAGFSLARAYGPAAMAIGTAIGIGLAAGFYLLTLRIDRRLHVWPQITFWNFHYRHGGRGNPAVEARFASFADHALERLHDHSFDEIIVVSVSSAGYYTIEMLGRMLERDPDLAGRRVALLTFGVQPSITSWFGPRKNFVQALTSVLKSPAIEWLAYSMRGDIMTVAEYDPFRDVGLDRKEFDQQKIIHHRIHLKRMLTPSSMQAVRRDFLWLHLHYLRTSETGDEHDFFAIACTSLPTLAAAKVWRERALAARTMPASEVAAVAAQKGALTAADVQ